VRVLLDPETGELVEVLESDTAGVGAYDLPQFRRAVMGQTREKREALAELERAAEEQADAEANYRRVLAQAVIRAKAEHGATVAEVMAKGTDEVVEAHRRKVASEGKVRAAHERLKLCSEDRASLHRLGEWSAQQERYGEEPRP
jgi:RecA-family ATPase